MLVEAEIVCPHDIDLLVLTLVWDEVEETLLKFRPWGVKGVVLIDSTGKRMTLAEVIEDLLMDGRPRRPATLWPFQIV